MSQVAPAHQLRLPPVLRLVRRQPIQSDAICLEQFVQVTYSPINNTCYIALTTGGIDSHEQRLLSTFMCRW